MSYDGKDRLGKALAALYGCSAKNNNKIAKLIKQARDALSVTCNPKHLPDDVKLEIYRWHVDRTSAATAIQTDIVGDTLGDTPLTQAEPLADVVGVQVPPLVEGADREAIPEPEANALAPAIEATGAIESVQIMPDPSDQRELPPVSLVQDIKQTAQPLADTTDEAAKPSDGAGILLPGDAVQDIKRDNAIYDVKHNSPIQDVKQDAPPIDDGTGPDDYAQVHFALTVIYGEQAKRTTVMLEGYLVKALQRKYRLGDNKAIRVWIERAIKADSGRFDGNAPLTKQVKRIIVESFV
ncbi:hypothetical protein [Methylovulum psychrotolerans]|uniref:Uncharacterized protein n=1 Tax=Methylovulum psychrotolerans TaxID=1704499 RepID=A0A2S5CR18_9GAMM|nr:hypothetical protein [Methylovulum psychrotolerans]POZ53192.1 hypothetical protein AADEFJLK_00208 [Methylovulum psychrotolerans]